MNTTYTLKILKHSFNESILHQRRDHLSPCALPRAKIHRHWARHPKSFGAIDSHWSRWQSICSSRAKHSSSHLRNSHCTSECCTPQSPPCPVDCMAVHHSVATSQWLDFAAWSLLHRSRSIHSIDSTRPINNRWPQVLPSCKERSPS